MSLSRLTRIREYLRELMQDDIRRLEHFSISAVMFRAQPVPNPDNPRGPARYTSVDIMGEMSAGLFTKTSNTIRNDLKKEGFDVDG